MTPHYVVAAGDSAWTIGNRLNTSVGGLYGPSGDPLTDPNDLEAGETLTFAPFWWQNDSCVF